MFPSDMLTKSKEGGWPTLASVMRLATIAGKPVEGAKFTVRLSPHFLFIPSIKAWAPRGLRVDGAESDRVPSLRAASMILVRSPPAATWAAEIRGKKIREIKSEDTTPAISKTRVRIDFQLIVFSFLLLEHSYGENP